MMAVRRSNERGHFNFGWLDTYHTFSFGDYYDPARMGFRVLRVINEDRVAPGGGFPTHPHRDMEIVTYVLEGELEHKDSLGNGSVIRPGDVQRMSAGTGVRHSEFNHSQSAPVHLLQIWILPECEGIEPGYEQKRFDDSEKRGRLCLVASSNGAEGSVVVHQDARLFAALLEKGESVTHDIPAGRHVWIHVARGKMTVDGTALAAGDAAAISNEDEVKLSANDSAEVLLFDLP